MVTIVAGSTLAPVEEGALGGCDGALSLASGGSSDAQLGQHVAPVEEEGGDRLSMGRRLDPGREVAAQNRKTGSSHGGAPAQLQNGEGAAG
jgi:hypothetical protein